MASSCASVRHFDQAARVGVVVDHHRHLERLRRRRVLLFAVVRGHRHDRRPGRHRRHRHHVALHHRRRHTLADEPAAYASSSRSGSRNADATSTDTGSAPAVSAWSGSIPPSPAAGWAVGGGHRRHRHRGAAAAAAVVAMVAVEPTWTSRVQLASDGSHARVILTRSDERRLVDHLDSDGNAGPSPRCRAARPESVLGRHPRRRCAIS